MSATLILTEDVRVHGQHCARVVAEILGDFIHRRPQPQPRRCGIVAQGVTIEPEAKLPHNAHR
ncbi:hypothetical protein [Microbacterium sp. Root166]|uniref:hypothetical protein n=1 Tax=Microbacterium sp. Root166 TaxID=1736478 RepID=UPI00138F038A|nr:hypothetical protein [Microbacterium sp. Root166]